MPISIDMDVASKIFADQIMYLLIAKRARVPAERLAGTSPRLRQWKNYWPDLPGSNDIEAVLPH